jgi:hypothetical protein
MHLDLSDNETAALLRERDNIIDRGPLPDLAPHPDLESDPRQTQAGAARKPAPPPKHYQPPRVGRKATAIGAATTVPSASKSG